MAIPPLRRRRRVALLRGPGLVPGLGVLLGLRLVTVLLWPVAVVHVLAFARAPRRWRRLAGRTLSRAVSS